MAMLSIFDNDPAFSFMELSATVNAIPYTPGRLGRPIRPGGSPLFQVDGIRTLFLAVEAKAGILSLVQTTPRGGPGGVPLPQGRNVRALKVPHLQQNDAVVADEVQGIRAFGSETEVQSVQALVNERLSIMQDNILVTQEYHRVHAMQGIILDADGSVLYNLFNEFGVTQQTFAFDFGDPAGDPELELRRQIVTAKRLSEDALGGAVINGYLGLAGRGFWDALISHQTVVTALAAQQGERLGQDLREVGFQWGGVTWEEYRGAVAPQAIGASPVKFIEDNEAWLIPDTSPSIFITRYAPADYEETVNTKGLIFYARQAPDPSGFNKYRALEVQSNPISICLRPAAVVKLTMAA